MGKMVVVVVILEIVIVNIDILVDIIKLYIQVVPGRAGGGSFRKKKEVYSKERICL